METRNDSAFLHFLSRKNELQRYIIKKKLGMRQTRREYDKSESFPDSGRCRGLPAGLVDFPKLQLIGWENGAYRDINYILSRSMCDNERILCAIFDVVCVRVCVCVCD